MDARERNSISGQTALGSKRHCRDERTHSTESDEERMMFSQGNVAQGQKHKMLIAF